MPRPHFTQLTCCQEIPGGYPPARPIRCCRRLIVASTSELMAQETPMTVSGRLGHRLTYQGLGCMGNTMGSGQMTAFTPSNRLKLRQLPPLPTLDGLLLKCVWLPKCKVRLVRMVTRNVLNCLQHMIILDLPYSLVLMSLICHVYTTQEAMMMVYFQMLHFFLQVTVY